MELVSDVCGKQHGVIEFLVAEKVSVGNTQERCLEKRYTSQKHRLSLGRETTAYKMRKIELDDLPHPGLLSHLLALRYYSMQIPSFTRIKASQHFKSMFSCPECRR